MILLASIVMVSACAEGCGPGAILLTEEDSGRRIEARARQAITISLKSNMTTGYCWNLLDAPDNAIVKLISSRYIRPKGGLMGAGGRELWIFRTMRAGRADISLGYYRPFEPEKKPERIFTLTLKVTERPR